MNLLEPNFILGVFVLIMITIPVGVGSLFAFRGTYYKSLPAKVEALEKDSERKDAALRRQAEELELWKGVATQTPEIQKLIELWETHEDRATAATDDMLSKMQENQKEIMGNHTEILRLLDRLLRTYSDS